MSVETVILKELINQLELVDSALKGKIFYKQSDLKRSLLPYQIQLVLVPTSPTELTTKSQIRNVVVQITFTQSSGRNAKYADISELKENILGSIHHGNRPYWHDLMIELETYDLEDDDRYKGVEGFILEINFKVLQQITC